MSLSLTYPAPEVAPSEVSGGGGSRSELVITWDVSVWVIYFPPGYTSSSNHHSLHQCDDDDNYDDNNGDGNGGGDAFVGGSNCSACIDTGSTEAGIGIGFCDVTGGISASNGIAK